MKKNAIRWIAVFKLFIVLLYPLLALTFPSQVSAAGNCKDNPLAISISGLPGSFSEGSQTEIKLTLTNLQYLANDTYKIQVYDEGDVFRDVEGESNPAQKVAGQNQLIFTIPNGRALQSDGSDILNDDHYVYLYNSSGTNVCVIGTYNTTPAVPHCDEVIKVSQTRVLPNGNTTTCYADGNSCIAANSPVNVSANVKNIDGSPYNGPVYLFIDGEYGFTEKSVTNGNLSFTHTSIKSGPVTVKLYAQKNSNWGGATTGVAQFEGKCSSYNLNYRPSCDDATSGSCLTTEPTSNTLPSDDATMAPRVFQLCTQITNTELKGKCDECYGKQGVWTAVGCIQRTPQSIVKTFLEIGLGVGGGICLLMCLAAGFMITTSQGDPKQVSEGREMITSAVIGLLFIIFSVFILQFIGVTIFNIPGFGVTPKP